MTTALDLITTAALKLGAIQSGEALTSDEASDSLNVLNSMLDSWALDRLLVFQIVQDNYTWTGGQVSQTIGSGGNFNGTRPILIEEGCFFRDTLNNDYPVTILQNRLDYDRIAAKSIGSTIPLYIFYDPSYPLGTLYAYPYPSASISFYLNHWQVLQSFAALTTVLSLPPGYKWAIEHNLAVHLQPIFSLPCPDSVIVEAGKSFKRLMVANAKTIYATTETASLLKHSKYKHNIYAGM